MSTDLQNLMAQQMIQQMAQQNALQQNAQQNALQPSLGREIYGDLKSTIKPVSEFGKIYSVYSLIITTIIVIVVVYFSFKLINYNSSYLTIEGIVMQDSICISSDVYDSKNQKTGSRLSCQTLIKFKPIGGKTGSNQIIYQQIYSPNPNGLNALAPQGSFINVGYDETTGEYNQVFDSSSSKYNKGDKVTVYYKPSNVSTSATLTIIPNAIGWVVICIALLVLFSAIFWTYAGFKNDVVSTAQGGAAVYGLFRR